MYNHDYATRISEQESVTNVDLFRLELAYYYCVNWDKKLEDTRSYGRLNPSTAVIKHYAGVTGLSAFNGIIERLNAILSDAMRGRELDRSVVMRELNKLADWLKAYTGITMPKIKKDKYDAFVAYVDKCARLSYGFRSGQITGKVSYKPAIKSWLWNYAFATLHNIPVGYVFEADLDATKAAKKKEREEKKAQKSA